MAAYLIQGFFFQDHMFFGVGYRSPDGAVATVNVAKNAQFMFAGSIWTEPSLDSKLVGHMVDEFGHAEIGDIKISDQALKFSKRYETTRGLRKRPPIFYVFDRKDGESWIGTYEGKDAGKGIARCMLTSVPDDFFEPLPLAAKLGVSCHDDDDASGPDSDP